MTLGDPWGHKQMQMMEMKNFGLREENLWWVILQYIARESSIQRIRSEFVI